MSLSFLFNITFSFCLFLSSASVTAKEYQKSIDINKNKINDRFEYYNDKKLIRIEIDQNEDGKIDFITVLNNPTYFKIEIQDTNNNGKFNRKKSYKILSKNKIEILIEIDSDHDQIFDIKYSDIKESLEKKDKCIIEKIESSISQLSKNTNQILSYNNKGFINIGTGYSVDQKCLEKWGDSFILKVKDSMKSGLQCLLNLDKTNQSENNDRISGAFINAYEITELQKNNSISIVCSEDDYKHWEGAAAHASSSKNSEIGSKKIKHPFISINPNYPDTKGSPTSDESFFIAQTLFHEQLHNLGYKHGDSVEYPYTCGKCCFNEEKSDETDMACKICSGNYLNEADPNYIKDFAEYSLRGFSQRTASIASETIKKYMKENKKSSFGLIQLAKVNSNYFNPIGPEIANLIELNSITIDKNNKNDFDTSKEWKNNEMFKKIKKSSQVLAQIQYEIYYNKSSDNALNLLETNKEILKKEFNLYTQLGEKDTSYLYILENVKQNLDDIIYELWINKYPNNSKEIAQKNSDRAYQIRNFFL